MNLTEPRELASLLEAFLLASGKPQSLERLYELFEEGERPEPAVFKKALTLLGKSCEGRAFELKEVSSGYRLQIREKFSPWVGRLWEERPQRYSRALLETIALIAYRQPITRGEIEDVRGVAVNSNIVKTLLEREWIRVVGYRDVPGKPAMFATTKAFLDHFNLKNLEDLPPLAELREMEAEPVLDFDDAPVPQSLQELADASAEPEEEKKKPVSIPCCWSWTAWKKASKPTLTICCVMRWMAKRRCLSLRSSRRLLKLKLNLKRRLTPNRKKTFSVSPRPARSSWPLSPPSNSLNRNSAKKKPKPAHWPRRSKPNGASSKTDAYRETSEDAVGASLLAKAVCQIH